MAKNIQEINQNTRDWLLDPADPGPRYLALRDIFRLSSSDPELVEAKHRAHTQGPIAEVLSQMQPEGFWEKPGPGYGPKYKSTVWSLILLAQLGADAESDERIQRACSYLLDNSLHPEGQLSSNVATYGTIDCLQGNLCSALLDLGCSDPRLDIAFDWMACTVTGDGIAPPEDRKAPRRYYVYKSGPNFECGVNNKLPCAWGAAKVMSAFARLPKNEHSPVIDQAIKQGIAFFFSVDPAQAAYPSGYAEKPSANWWRFGFPVYYVTDILQIVESLVLLGYGQDARLQNALKLIQSKQDAEGRWALEYNYGSKTWGNYGRKGQPNKWVTIRAFRVLT